MKCEHCHKDAPENAVCEDCKMTEKPKLDFAKEVYEEFGKKQEFNLSDERKELVQVLRNKFGIHNSKAWSIVKRVVEQDKEFIKRLKEVVIWKCGKNTDNALFWNEQIDALAGKDLI